MRTPATTCSSARGTPDGHRTRRGKSAPRTAAPTARWRSRLKHVFEAIVDSGPDFGGIEPTVFLAGDDLAAKEAVGALARDIGYEPVDAGPLSAARYLEPAAGLLASLAYGQGLRPQIALKLLRR